MSNSSEHEPPKTGTWSASNGGHSANLVDVAMVRSWHAHVYFDAATREAAQALRDRIVAVFGASVDIGRFHERPVGPHPCWSYQVAFEPEAFAHVATWLALNHGGLDVLLHPNTSDALTDHRDRAMWIGHSHALDLTVLGG